MKPELMQRISTSIILFIFIYFALFVNLYASLISLVIISVISWFEFIKLINKIYSNKNEILSNLILVISAMYFVIFGAISYYLIAIDKIYFLYILAICSFSDIGGYIFGKTFKGKKLTKISPNKTVSGLYGSFIFALIPSVFLKIVFLYSNIEIFAFANNLIINFAISLYLSLVSQLGDLFISYFKRLANVKDTGKILPGHGGILDRIDGIIFAIPSFGIIGYLSIY